MPKLPKGQFYVGRDPDGGFYIGPNPIHFDGDCFLTDQEQGSDINDCGTGACPKHFLPLIRGQPRIPKGRQAIVEITVKVIELLPKE